MGKAFKAALILAGIVASFQAGRAKGCADSVKFLFDNAVVDRFTANKEEVVVTSRFKVKKIEEAVEEVENEPDN